MDTMKDTGWKVKEVVSGCSYLSQGDEGRPLGETEVCEETWVKNTAESAMALG